MVDAGQKTPTPTSVFNDRECQFSVIAHILAIINLDEVVLAVRRGLLQKRAWDTLLRTRFSEEPGTASALERKAASRAQRRLVEWSAKAA